MPNKTEKGLIISKIVQVGAILKSFEREFHNCYATAKKALHLTIVFLFLLLLICSGAVPFHDLVFKSCDYKLANAA